MQGSEKTDLLRSFLSWPAGLAVEYLHPLKLFVGDRKCSYFTVRWQEALDARFMYIGVLVTRAVACIDGKLHHRKAIVHQCATKIVICLARGFRVCWQIEHGNDTMRFAIIGAQL